MTTDFDVVVVGGGPAGATAAAYLAKAGKSVAVFESEMFPRPHVGESLVPATTRVLLETGAMEEVENAGFPRKYGASWTTPGKHSQLNSPALSFDFDGHAAVQFNERAQEGVDRDHTFHVDRGKFDLILLKHAESLGAKVFQGVRITAATTDDPGQVSVTARIGGRRVEVSAQMLVDASGRQTLLGRDLRLKEHDPVFDQYAIHAWFEGLDREALAETPSETENILIHFLPLTDSWVWQIPITDTVTSIGVVTQKKQFADANVDREKFFWKFVRTRPDLAQELRKAEQVRPFKAEGDYSYSMTQVAGDRYVMIGDAARFVDPIFSSGVSIAMNTARLACDDILAAFDARDFRRERFARYEELQRLGTRNWYEFISIYYRLNILFGAFVQDPRYRLDVLQMLQGDMYQEDPPALAAMREIVTEVENDPGHVWHPYLGTLRAPLPQASAPA